MICLSVFATVVILGLQIGMSLAQQTEARAVGPALPGAATPVTPVFEGAGWWEYVAGGVLYDVFFVDALHGWAVGDSAWRTEDGGATWQRVPLFGVGNSSGNTLQSVVFGDSQIGWIAKRSGGVLRSGDGGRTWNAALDDPAYNSSPPFLDAVDAQTVWTGRTPMLICEDHPTTCVPYAQAFRSTDGGSNWERKYFLGTCDLLGLDFIDRQHGRVTVWSRYGDTSVVLAATTNGGETWSEIKIGDVAAGQPSVVPGDVSFASPSHGWMIWQSPYNGPWSIAHTTDSGLTWTEQYTAAGGSFTWLQAFDVDRAWAGLGTSNGGATWQQLTANGPTRARFRTAQEGWGGQGWHHLPLDRWRPHLANGLCRSAHPA